MTVLPRYFVFDVESVGLYGEDFAVAYTVVDRSGTELDAGLFNCEVNVAAPAIVAAELSRISGFADALDLYEAWNKRSEDDQSWISVNVLPRLPEASHTSREQMHGDFWDMWKRWRERGATMWADWGYPVEVSFLRSCILEDPSRIDTSPYPLMEIATVRALAGIDPALPRKFEHLPAHDPLNDCRHSARVLIESLNRLGV